MVWSAIHQRSPARIGAIITSATANGDISLSPITDAPGFRASSLSRVTSCCQAQSKANDVTLCPQCLHKLDRPESKFRRLEMNEGMGCDGIGLDWIGWDGMGWDEIGRELSEFGGKSDGHGGLCMSIKSRRFAAADLCNCLYTEHNYTVALLDDSLYSNYKYFPHAYVRNLYS